MFVVVFGDPSLDVVLALGAIKELMKNAFDSYQLIYEGTADKLAKALTEASYKNIVYFSDAPDRNIIKLFMESDVSILVLIHDPLAIVDSLILERKFDRLTSVRLASLSLACLHDLALRPRSRVISEAINSSNFTKYVDQLASACQIPVDEAILKKAVSCFTFMEPRRLRTNHESDAISSWLVCFKPLLKKAAVSTIQWPPEVFLNADEQGAHVRGPIDLTGRARLFLYGPYFHIPPGHWVAEITFDVWENLSGNVVKVDVCLDDVAGEWKFKLPDRGSFTFELPFEVSEPRHPVQIRFFLMQGAIEGFFELKQVRLRRAHRS